MNLALALLALVFSTDCAGRGMDFEIDAGGALDTGAEVSSLPFQCRNQNKDVGETDLNCGGPCPPCALNQGCAQDADCSKGHCVLETAKCTAPATCSNGRKDASETDVDCGGADCAGCAANRACRQGSDCASLTCASDRCN